MEGLEDGDARPRQVRYQAALRPDMYISDSNPHISQALGKGPPFMA